jgi:peptidoglycan hydrolase CwlO-like protein
MQYLSEMIIKVEDIARMISFATKLVEQLQEHPALLEHHKEEIKDLLEEYNMEVALLRHELDRYFELERRQKLPANLSLHRAYENLKHL